VTSKANPCYVCRKLTIETYSKYSKTPICSQKCREIYKTPQIYREYLQEGIEKSIQNAERLLYDAEKLHETERFSSSFLLSCLSLEECAKAHMIWQRKFYKKPIFEKEWNRARAPFKSHLFKLEEVQHMLDYIAKVVDDSGSFERFQKKHAKRLQRSKEANTYVDYNFLKKEWKTPNCGKSDSEVNLRFSRTVLSVIKKLVAQGL